jgi:tetratricopeptide (TPR) repeat protein
MEQETTPQTVKRVDRMLREGIQLAREGERTRARELLMRVVELDERRVAAWLWLSDVVDDTADRELCLENVLALDPGNEAAQAGLRWLRNHEVRATEAVDAQEDDTPAELWEEPPHPLRCPYCAAMSKESDRRCPSCGGQLWIRTRRRPTHSFWLWNLVSIRVAICVGCVQLCAMVLAWLGQRLTGEYDPLLLLPAYLGLQHANAALAQAAFEIVPRAYLLPLLLLSAYSLLLLVGMYLRWRIAYYTMVGGAAARLVLSLALILLGHRPAIYAGGLGVLVSALSVPVLMAVADDFAWDAARVYFGLDKREKGGTARLERAQALAGQGMWALAVLYLRAAAVQLPGHSAVYARLARAYVQLGRRDQALRALEDAVRVHPGDPALAELADQLRDSQHQGQSQREGADAPLSRG